MAVPPTLAPALRQCQRLTHLDLGMNFLEPDSIGAILPTLPGMRLMHLKLRGCAMPDAGALGAALVGCRALTHVSLHNCGLRGGFGLLDEVWPALPALEALDVSYNAVVDEDMAELAGVLTLCVALRTLIANRNSVRAFATAALEAALAACPLLERLDLREAQQIGDEDAWEPLAAADEVRLAAAWAPRADAKFLR